MFLEAKHLQDLATHYKQEFSQSEAAVAKNYINAMRKNTEDKITMEMVYSMLDKDVFPTIKKLFQIALTVPVTSCKCERSFSCLRRVKIWKRNRMTQGRMDHLSVLAIERKTYAACTDCELVTAFDNQKKRRL